jgi:hypothetical protein
MATVATQIIAALTRSGVRHVYGLPGDSLTDSPTPFAAPTTSRGSTFDTRRLRPPRRAPRRTGAGTDGAFTHGGPAIVDVVTARQELSIPPAINAEQAKGFSLYAIRTIMAGRADELLDLVTTNVSRRLLD